MFALSLVDLLLHNFLCLNLPPRTWLWKLKNKFQKWERDLECVCWVGGSCKNGLSCGCGTEWVGHHGNRPTAMTCWALSCVTWTLFCLPCRRPTHVPAQSAPVPADETAHPAEPQPASDVPTADPTLQPQAASGMSAREEGGTGRHSGTCSLPLADRVRNKCVVLTFMKFE